MTCCRLPAGTPSGWAAAAEGAAVLCAEDPGGGPNEAEMSRREEGARERA
jgi:hypothetical protein